MTTDALESIMLIDNEAEYAQLRLIDDTIVAEVAEHLETPQGVLVQHYPRTSETGLHVQLGRQYREEGSEIEWPNSYKGGRAYLQSDTGDRYLIVGHTFHN